MAATELDDEDTDNSASQASAISGIGSHDLRIALPQDAYAMPQ